MENLEKNQIYTCPMHPEIEQEKPGICSECGMNLVKKNNNLKTKNHIKTIEQNNKHKGHNIVSFLKKFWVSLILTIPILFYSDLLKNLFSFEVPYFTYSIYLSLILGSIVFFYGGAIFLTSSYREIKGRSPGMMTLISLAITTAYIYSVFVVIFGNGVALFWELSSLITIMLLGHYIEMKSVKSAQGALSELAKLIPDEAELVINNKNETKKTLVSELKINDIIIVRPGGRIPSDGIVIEGESDVDESMITGESKPITKNIKSEVISGTLNLNGSLVIKVKKIGENTFLSGIIKLVRDAQSSKSRLQLLSDKAAFYLTIIAILSGISAFIFWIFIAPEFSFAIERMVAVLVIACPHALGLAIPLVSAISTTKAAQNGFLIRDKISLEKARKIDTVLFDKTGTLTKGEYGVTNILSVKPENKDYVLRLAASVNNKSEHSISKAIIKYAKDKKLKLFEVKNFQRLAGIGVKGKIKENIVFIGGEKILKETKINLQNNIKLDIKKFSNQGKTIIYVIENKKIIGVMALSDIIREESRETIKKLNNMGFETAMVTGDSEEVARFVSQELGINKYFAKIMPDEKLNIVAELQKENKKIAFVGDGMNDAPALTQADLGIAIGSGTNIAIESAGIILVKNDPRDIVKIIKLSKLTYSKMIQNLFWATSYNIVAIPLAGGILYYQGILLQPALAAIFMSASTVIVAFNAMLLKQRVL